MDLFIAKIKTDKGLYEKPVAVPRRHVKVVQKFLDDLYNTDVTIKSILGFRRDEWSYDEFGEDPEDEEERIDSLP